MNTALEGSSRHEIHPLAGKHDASFLFKPEGKELHSKEWRLWHETTQAQPFTLLHYLGQGTESLFASIALPLR
jgi:hypothetical protein